MTTKIYEGNTHVFYSNNNPIDGKIYLKAKNGQQLIVEGTATNAAGPNKSIQFNNSGSLDGEAGFTYDEITGEMSVDAVDCEAVNGYKDSSTLGFNTLYQGPTSGFPQTLTSSFVQTLENFGYDIEINKGSFPNIIASACPSNNPLVTGGVSVWSSSSHVDNFAQYASPLLMTNFTDDGFLRSAGVSNSTEQICFTDNSQNGYLYLFKRTGGIWALQDDTTADSKFCKMTDNTIISASYLSVVSIYNVVANVITHVQDLHDYATPLGNMLLQIDRNYCVFCDLSTKNLRVYYYDGATWIEKMNFTDMGVNYSALDIINPDSTESNVTLVHCGNTGLVVYENDDFVTPTFTFSGDYNCCCVNENYIFTFEATNSEIHIFQKVDGAWEFTNQVITTQNGITKMSCNEYFLACGQPALNKGTVFKIVPYTEGPVLINQISMGVTESNNKLTINSMYGTEFDNNVQISGTTTTNLLNVQSAGTVSSPAINFGSSTGIYEDTNEINVCVGGVDKLVVNTNYTETGNVRIGDGTVSSPAVSFSSDLDTGIYKSAADEIAITTGGNRMMRISQADGVRMDGNLTINNDLFFGSVNNSIQNVADLYMRIDAVGGTRMTWDGVHTVSYVPYRTLHNGDVSHPAFSFIDSTNTGMYLEPGNTLSFAVDGVKVAEFNNTPNLIKTDNYYGLTTNTTGIAMTTNMRLLTNNTDRLMLGNGGNNLTTASFGDSSNLNSQNPTGGSIVKVVASGAGKWGQENVVLVGATQFHLFLATTTGVGSITTNGATTSYNTTSDYRLKENVELLTNQLERIDKLKPVKYTWKNKEINGEGFLAHELAEVFPEAVYGEKDAVDENGKIVPQGIDTTFLTGSLVACIKELRTELNAAKIEIEAMKTEMATFV